LARQENETLHFAPRATPILATRLIIPLIVALVVSGCVGGADSE
jgi:hypothetical protein